MTMRAYTLLCALMIFISMHSMDFNPGEHLTGGKAGGVVGSIPMEIGVNNTGAATFSIPIELPQGCGGLTPELSINYNSFGDEGMFGKGIDIDGLSAIYRMASSTYFNGKDCGVRLSVGDALCIDGTPLIKNDENSLEYHCRIGDIYSIVADSETKPQSFTVKDGNGIIKEYGRSDNSRLKGQGVDSNDILAWLLERVSDSYGNYYTISYGFHPEMGYCWIKSIDYSANEATNISSKIKISFEHGGQGTPKYYKNSSFSILKNYSSIKVSVNGKDWRKYEFNYEYDDDRAISRLKSIKVIGSDGKTYYNPIEIEWQSSSFSFEEPMCKNIYELANYSIKFGDFNGDGLPDLLAIPLTQSVETNIKYYVGDGNGNFKLRQNFVVPATVVETFIADFNGDGRDDFMCMAYGSGNYVMRLYESDGYVFHDYNNVTFEMSYEHVPLIGDFNGDGAADIALVLTEKNDTGISFYLSKSYEYLRSASAKMIIAPLNHKFVAYSSSPWEEVQVGNFSGGSNTGLINIKSRGHECYSVNDSTESLEELHTGSLLQKSVTHYLGDFNGDGKTDIIETSNRYGVLSKPVIYFGTGTRFIRKEITQSDPFNEGHHIYISDVNGDGKDDISSIPISTSAHRNRILTLLNNGDGLTYTLKQYDLSDLPAADQCFYNMVDLYGEGRNVLVGLSHNQNNFTGDYRIFNKRAECQNVVSKIIDGLGNSSEFKYERLTDYSSAAFSEVWDYYPYSGCSMPMALVKKMVQSNVRGDELTTSYDYKDARTHLGKASFLGFKHVVTTGSDKNTRHDYYDLDPDFGMLNTCSQTFSQDNILLQNDSTQYVRQTSDSGVSLVFPNNIVSRHYSPVNRSNYLTKEIQRTYDSWGNILTESTITNGSTTETTKYKYRLSNADSLYLKHRPSEKETRVNNGTLGRRQKETYAYFNHAKLSMMTDFINNNGRNRINYRYDEFGNLISKRYGRFGGAADTNKSTLFEYSNDGRFCMKESGEMDFFKTYEYDAYGNRTVIASSDGVTDSTSYDSFGNPKVNVHNGIKTEKGRVWSNGIAINPTHGVYCEYSRQGSNPYHLIFFDSRGNKLRECDEINGKTVFVDYEYDNNGRLISESLPYFSGEDKKETLYSYDELGNLIAKILPNGYTQSMEYDYSIDGVATIVSTESGESVHLVDHFNRLVWSENELGQRVDYSYNTDGECTQADVDGLVTSFSQSYFSAARTSRSNSNPEYGNTKYTYDEFGNLSQKTRADFPSTNNVYDKLGRVKSRSTGKDYVFLYSYFDGKPDCIKTITNTSKGYKHEFTYDIYNRPLTETYSFNDTIYTTACDYDNDGRVKEFTYPNGLKLQYEYSGNLLTAIKNAADGSDIWRASEFNAGGKPTKCTYGSVVTANMEYDSSTGRMLKAQYDSLLTINYTLNNRGLIASKTCNTIIPLNYSYDKIGRLISSVYKMEMIRPEFPIDPINPIYPYEPIALNTYSNDYFIPRDSMIFNPDFPQKPVYAKFEQHYSYDDHNNVQALGGTTFSSITYADGATRIVENKLDSAAIRWNNIAFADINRVAEIDNATDTLLLDYGENDERIRSTLTTSGNKISRHYISSFFENIYVDGQSIPVCYITANNKLVAVFVQDAMYYVLTDHLGSVIKVVDGNRNIVADYDYSDWGHQIVSKKEVAAHPWLHYFNRGYCGHEHLPEFSLINMDARIYDPVDMRFLSPDPYVQNPMLPQNFNRYSYCLNNPINYTDPTGELFGIDNFIIGFWTGLFKGGLDRAFSEGWKSMKNCYKIRLGLFKSGHSSFLKQVFEVGSRFTWQLPQTVLGYAWAETNNTLGFVKDVDYYGGATIVRTKMISSSVAVTMGSYIVGGSDLEANPYNPLFQHEYGHYIQSQIWGPLWSVGFGIPSLGSMLYDKWIEEGTHKWFYTEIDANRHAYKYFRQRIDGFTTTKFPTPGWYIDKHPLSRKDKHSKNLNENKNDLINILIIK